MNTPDARAIRAALDAMRERVEAATPGPWGDQTSLPHLEPGVASWHPEGGALICCDPDGDDRDADRRFIAHARQDLPALLAVAEAVASVGPLVVARDEAGQVMTATVRGDEWEAVTRALAALAEPQP